MATNVQKTPFARTLNDAMRGRAANATQRLGKTLPCSVVERVSSKIVKVKFEIQDQTITFPPATMPIFGSEFIREPIQAGCKGMAIAADAFLGGMTGLGTGTATLNEQPNLSCLMFMPLGNTGFSQPDLKTLVLYGGDNGTTILDANNANSSISLTKDSITLSSHGHQIVIDSTGVHIDGKVFLTHEHSGVSGGVGNTGPVV